MRIVFPSAPALVAIVAGCASPPASPPVTVVAVASAAPPRPPPLPEPSAAPPRAHADHGPLDVLVAAEHAYLEADDLAPLTALWSDDLRVRSGRSHEPLPTDAVFGKARLAVIDGWAAAHQMRVTATITPRRVDVTATHAFISWSVVMTAPGCDAGAFVDEYELVRRGDAWTMVRYDYWPVLPDTLEEFGSAFWADADAKVDAARAANDDRTLAYALSLAHRFDEFAAVSRRLTTASPKDEWAWGMRVTASALIGDEADAERALEAQRKLQSYKSLRP